MPELDTQPTLEEAWEEVARREGLSQHDSLEDCMNAVAEADNLLEASRKARIRRGSFKSVATWFGLAAPAKGGTTIFPPAGLQGRLRMLDQGILPKDARAREWGGLDE